MQACSADVNVMPIFLEEADDLHVDEEDLNASSLFLPQQQNDCKTEHAVSILHIPSGISAQSSGEYHVKAFSTNLNVVYSLNYWF